MEFFVYFTDIIGSRVYSHKGRYLGKVKDLIARSEVLYPLVLRFVIRSPRFGPPLDLPWEAVKSLGKKKIRLVHGGEKKLVPHYQDPEELVLRLDILDMQILDTDGAKVVRVADIHLLNTDEEMRIVHVDVGFRGILRRLGYTRLVDTLTEWLFAVKFKEQLIGWKYIVPLGGHFSPLKLKLSLAQRRLADLHPADLADIMEELAVHERQALFSSLDVETAGEALEEIDNPKLQTELLGAVDEEVASDILEEMEPDEAVDLLIDLPEEVTEELVDAMEDKERAGELRLLMTHQEGSAGSIMTTEYLTISPQATVRQALTLIRKSVKDVEDIYYMYAVTKEGKLCGVVSIKELVTAKGTDTIRKVMHKKVISVKDDDSVKLASEIISKYSFIIVPVVDNDEHLLGVIYWKDAVEAVLPQFAED